MTNVTATVLNAPPRSLSIREDDFVTWIAQAAPGAAVEYHRGHLSVDRAPGLSPFGEKARWELGAVADRAMTLAAEAQLLLVQDHHAEGDASYIAIKPMKPPAHSHAAIHIAGAANSSQPVDQREHAMGDS